LLETIGDRIPLAPYTLTSFASNGSTDAAIAFGLVAGRFTSERDGDVVALASDEPFGSNTAFWLGPEIRTSSSSPLRMDDLSPTLQPIAANGLNVTVMLASTSADLDGDGFDESIWLMPYRSETPDAEGGPPRDQCSIMILRTPFGTTTPVADAPIVLDEPCTRPAVSAVDVDADDRPDLVLLTGDTENAEPQGKLIAPLESASRPAPTKKQLSILWNDGAGNFAPDQGALLSAVDESPEAFTTLARSTQQPFRVVYITDTAVRLVSATTFPRTLASPLTLTEVEGATGIVSGDIDGDGIIDLAIAASGDVRILRAALTQ
jgi:hypothetical protein